MKNFIAPGNQIDLTAPAGGVVSGAPYRIGTFVGFAGITAAAGDKFPLAVQGEFTAPTDTGTAWAEGEVLYFDAGASVFTKTAVAGGKVGASCTPKLPADTTAIIRIQGFGS